MLNLQPKKDKIKPGFIIHSSPAWLDQHQDWISDGARRLYKALRTLADARTGELAIPGRGDEVRWIKPTTIDRKVGMCDETRKKYMRELLALGAVRHGRKRITRRVGNRLRSFWGVSRYTLLELKRPMAANNAASSTAKVEQKTEIANSDAIPSTANSSTAKTKTDFLRPTSSTVEEIGHEYLSETTSRAGACSPAVGVPRPGAPADGSSGGATAPAVLKTGLGDCPDSPVHSGGGQDSPAPAPEYTGPLAFEKQQLATNLERAIWRELSGTGWDENQRSAQLRGIRKAYQEEADDLGIAFRNFRKLYEDTVRRIEVQLTPAKPRPAKPFGHIDTARLAELQAEDPDCLSTDIEDDGSCVLNYEWGYFHIVPGEPDPFWFAYDTPVPPASWDSAPEQGNPPV